MTSHDPRMLTADQWIARFQQEHGREATVSEFHAAQQSGQIAPDRPDRAPAAATASAPAPTSTPTTTPERAGWRAWVPLALPALAMLGLLSLLLPAATARASGWGASISENGGFFDSAAGPTGLILLLAMLFTLIDGVIALVVRKPWARLMAGAMGVLAGVVGTFIALMAFGALGSVSDSSYGVTVTATPGAGLILVLLVSLGLITAGIVMLLEVRQDIPRRGAVTPPVR